MLKKNKRYFDFKYLKIYIHFNISYNFYRLYFITTPRHPKLFLLENHVRVVALTPDLQKISLYNVNKVRLLQLYYQVYNIPNTYRGVLSKL